MARSGTNPTTIATTGGGGGGTVTPADAFVNPTDATDSWSLLGGFNGATWDRLRAHGNNSDAVAASTLGVLDTNSYTMFWDAFNGVWRRWAPVAADGGAGLNPSPTVNLAGLNGSGLGSGWTAVAAFSTADSLDPGGLGVLATSGFNSLFNGINWDRWRSLNAIGGGDANTGLGIGAVGSYLYNGTTWDRLREVPSADAQARTGLAANGGMVFNGSTWDRMRSGTSTGSVLVNNPTAANLFVSAVQSGAWTVAATQSGSWTTGRTWTLSNTTDSVNPIGTARDDTDNQAAVTTGATLSVNRLYGWDVSGSNWDRMLAVAGRLQVDAAQSGAWTVGVNNFPAVQSVAGNQTPGSSITTPTDAVDNRAFLELFNPVTGLWDAARKNPYDGIQVDNNPVTILLEQLLMEHRRTNRLLEILIGETPVFTDRDLESDG